MTGQVQKTAEPGAVEEEDFHRISKLVFDLTGIDLQPRKKNMITARLSKRLRATGLTSVSEYLDYLNSAAGVHERDHFISAYTTNMTRFNREEHHFQHLSKVILPPLIKRARRGEPLRLWSAGCSSGEEPYQIAFHLLELCPEAHKLDIKILATDIDRSVIVTAQAGVYPRALVAALPGQQGKTFFDPVSAGCDRLSVKSAARRLVVFRQLNLLDEWPFRRKFDVIMCRNVAIYFSAQVQTRLWHRFAGCLNPDGVIYIGHSESFGAASEDQFQICGNAAFRLRRNGVQEQGAARPSPPGWAG